MRTLLPHLGIAATYIAVLCLGQFLSSRSILETVLVAVGGAIGVVLPLILDAVVPILFRDGKVDVEERLKESTQVAVATLKNEQQVTASSQQSPLRSYPFLFAYAATALFVITSSGSPLGKGVVLGLGLMLLLDLLAHRTPVAVLKDRWFHTFRIGLTDEQLIYFVWASIAGFVLLSILGFFV